MFTELLARNLAVFNWTLITKSLHEVPCWVSPGCVYCVQALLLLDANHVRES